MGGSRGAGQWPLGRSWERKKESHKALGWGVEGKAGQATWATGTYSGAQQGALLEKPELVREQPC